MPLLEMDDIFICKGKMQMVTSSSVYLTYMELNSDILSFTGITKQMGNIFKNDSGYYHEIPVSDIKKVYKTKARLLHISKIETYSGDTYCLAKVDNRSMLGKKYAKGIAQSLNKFLSGVQYCPKCGKTVPKGDEFCGNCGTKM